MEDTHDVEFEEYEESWTGRIAIAAVVALALIAGAFFAGQAMAGDSGPATLAEAVQQAQSGSLPCGESAAPAATPAAGANGRAGGEAFILRAICQRGQTGQQPGGGAGAAGGQGGGRGRFGGGFGQTGQVKAVSGDTLTLTSPMGDRTVKLDGSTTVNTSSSGKVADIKAGDTVLVAGTGGQNNSGAAARSVTILPATGGN